MVTDAEKKAFFDGGRDAAVTEAAQMMLKKKWGGLGKRKTLREILTLLAGKRRTVASQQEDAAAMEFGAIRDNHPHELDALMNATTAREKMSAYGYVSSRTEITGRYPTEVQEVADVIANPGRLRSASIIRGPDTVAGPGIVAGPGPVLGYHMKTPSGTKVTATASAGILDANLSWAHTPPSLVGVVLDEAEVWHSQLLTGADIIKVHALGMVTWHVCNAMPYKRGSAAVAEWYNLAAISAFGLQLGNRAGFIDLPAFRIDAARYAGNYKDVYEGRYHVA